jgi:anti-sigma B factor antagonist
MSQEEYVEAPSLASHVVCSQEDSNHLEVEEHWIEDLVVLRCRGRIVYRQESSALAERIQELLPEHHQIVLNLSEVTAVDSSGLGILVVLHLGVESAGGSLQICHPSPRIRSLFQLTNLTAVLNLHGSEAEAISACASHAR